MIRSNPLAFPRASGKLKAFVTGFDFCLCCAVGSFGYFDLWVREKGLGGHQYARPNTGASITRVNSGNGALPIRESKQGENKDNGAIHKVSAKVERTLV